MAMRVYSIHGALCLAVAAALLPLHSLAADAPNMSGTWKLTSTQTALTPEGGSIPFTATGRKQYQENKRFQSQGKFDEYDYTTSRCASPGLPRLMLMPGRFRIMQRPGWAMFQFEWNRLLRQVDLGGIRQQRGRGGGGPGGPAGLLDPFGESELGNGIPNSKGHWEGDTLVVETSGFAANTLLDNLVPHGYDLKTTERIRLKSANELEDRITIEDPEYFSKPWQTVLTFQRQADEPFPENVCLDKLKGWPQYAISTGTVPPGAAKESEPAAATAAGGRGGGPGGPPGGGPPGSRGSGPPGRDDPQPSADPRNFEGVWTRLGPLEFQITKDIVGNPTPYNDAAVKLVTRRVESLKKGIPYINQSALCVPPGAPWQFDIGADIRVFHSKDRIDFTFHEYHGLMQVVLDPAKAPPPGYMGSPVGHWDGDTLVVVSRGFKQNFWLDVDGTPASKDATLTMRIRKAKTDQWALEVQYTLDDPKYYTRPFSWMRQYTWRSDMTTLREYNCELQTGARQGVDPSLVLEPAE
jgi:hypothetical protein